MSADQQDGSARPGAATLIYNATAAEATRDLLEEELMVALVRMIPARSFVASEGEAVERKRFKDLMDGVGGLERCGELLGPEPERSTAFTYLKEARDIAEDPDRPFTREEMITAFGWAGVHALDVHDGFNGRTRLQHEVHNAYGGLPEMDEPAWIHSVLETFGRLKVANAVAQRSRLGSNPPTREEVAEAAPLLAAQLALGEASRNAPREDVREASAPRSLPGMITRRLFGWAAASGVGGGVLALASASTPVTAIIGGIAILMASVHIGGDTHAEIRRRASSRSRDEATRTDRRDGQNRLRAARTDLTDLVTDKTGVPQLPQLKPHSGKRDSGQRTR